MRDLAAHWGYRVRFELIQEGVSVMSIIGFVPHPETAVTVIDWVRTLAEKDEGTKFLCLESGTEGHTSHAVRQALGEKRLGCDATDRHR